jgi:hypothetical protein
VNEYFLGQRVRFKNPLKRVRVELRHVTKIEVISGVECKRELPINKEWLPVPSEETEGTIVGKRTLANGHGGTEADYSEWSGSTAYIPFWEVAETFTAWLVVKDLRSKPVLVRPEDIRRARLEWRSVEASSEQ